jgi:hypothetical protein
VGTVIDERHVIDESGSFELDEPFVEPASVVVKSEDATLVFLEGVDYRLVESGSIVELFVLPGGRLTTGTVVLVDYRFKLPLDGEANAWIIDYRASVTNGPLRVFFRRNLQKLAGDQEPVLIPATLREYDDMAAGARLGASTPVGNLSLSGEWTSRSRFGQLAAKQIRVRGAWREQVGARLQAGLAGSWTAQTNGSRFEIIDGTADVEYAITPRLRLEGRLSAYDWSQELGTNERFIGVGFGLEWQFRRIEITARYDRNAWTRGFERTEDVFLARVTRSF